MKRILITIKSDGTKKVEAEGFAGGDCKLATKPFEAGQVQACELKPEFHQPAQSDNEQQVGQ